MPFFSVIIPTYNRAKSITEAIQSVVNQTFDDFEILVIDDGSTDNTRGLVNALEQKDARIRYVYQNNAERSAARNRGIEISKGQYICFLDSDDIYLNNHLECFHKTISENDFPIAFFLGNSLAEKDGELVKDPPYVTQTDDPVELMLKISFCSQQVSIHNSILREHKYDINLRVGEDQELWSRIVRYFPVIRSNQYTIVIRDLGDRTINYLNTETYISNLALRKRIIASDTEGRIRPEWRIFALSAAYYKLSISYLKSDNLLLFYWNILRSMLIDPSHFPKDKLLIIAYTVPFLKDRVKHKLPKFVMES